MSFDMRKLSLQRRKPNSSLNATRPLIPKNQSILNPNLSQFMHDEPDMSYNHVQKSILTKQNTFDHSRTMKRRGHERYPSSVISSIERLQIGLLKIQNETSQIDVSTIMQPNKETSMSRRGKRLKLRSAIPRHLSHNIFGQNQSY